MALIGINTDKCKNTTKASFVCTPRQHTIGICLNSVTTNYGESWMQIVEINALRTVRSGLLA